MSGAFIVFGATFLSVFTLGLQSLNVNQGHYLAAGVTSFFISTGHIFLYKHMPTPDSLQLLGYYAGGIAGITTSIWFHRSAKAWWRARGHLQRRGPPGPIPPCQPRPKNGERADVSRCGRCGGLARFAGTCMRPDCPRNDTDTH